MNRNSNGDYGRLTSYGMGHCAEPGEIIHASETMAADSDMLTALSMATVRRHLLEMPAKLKLDGSLWLKASANSLSARLRCLRKPPKRATVMNGRCC